MPLLYLIQLKRTTCNPDQDTHNYAILSRNPQVSLDNMNEGDITSKLNTLGLQVDLVVRKQVEEISSETFDYIINAQTPEDKVSVFQQKAGNLYLFINNEFFINLVGEKKQLSPTDLELETVEYPYVGIYD